MLQGLLQLTGTHACRQHDAHVTLENLSVPDRQKGWKSNAVTLSVFELLTQWSSIVRSLASWLRRRSLGRRAGPTAVRFRHQTSAYLGLRFMIPDEVLLHTSHSLHVRMSHARMHAGRVHACMARPGRESYVFQELRLVR